MARHARDNPAAPDPRIGLSDAAVCWTADV
jgi:hypothetical protein